MTSSLASHPSASPDSGNPAQPRRRLPLHLKILLGLLLGAGLGLAQARFFGRTTPLRVGFRRRGLPFALEGGGAHEQTFSGGFGLALNETNEIVLAALDVGVEKGNRTTGSYREDFWRATLSLRVSGF